MSTDSSDHAVLPKAQTVDIGRLLYLHWTLPPETSYRERPMPRPKNSIFDPQLFKPEAISDETRAFNKGIIAQFSQISKT